MLEIIILIISVLVNSILGWAVLIKNPNRSINRLFFGLTLSLSIWAIITYFSINPIGLAQITWVRLVLGSAAILCFFVLTSFVVFPDDSLLRFRLLRPAVYYLLFVVGLVQTPFVFQRLNYTPAGDAQPVVAPGIIFFMALIILFLGGAILTLVRKFRRSRGQIKNQLRIVIFGIATGFAAIVLTNFVLVSFFKNTSLISLAPLFALLLTGSMAYAILKHRLFDLRPAIARAMAYVLTFSMAILMYTGFAFLLSEIFSIKTNILITFHRYFYVSLAVITALAFQPVKRFFDKTTNKIFFKDSYDPQVLLDHLSSILVGNIQLEAILSQSAGLLVEYLKVTRADFIIGTEHKGYRITSHSHINDSSLPPTFFASLKKYHQEVILVDDLSYRDGALKSGLLERNYGAVIRLKTKTSDVGYMAVGNKKSGDIFSSLDTRVMGIVADELALAIENALRFEEIQKFNITLQEKVDEATRQLRRTNEKLKALDETKDEFISMASHQLRTPLTSVKGYVSMVLEGDAGKINDMQRKLLDQAFVSSQRMVYLIADLLNVSRLRTGKFVIEPKPTNLADVVEGELSQLIETAKSRNLELTFKKPDHFPLLMLDETKTRQVVMNFVDNAIYYTPSGGHIQVNLVENGDMVEFTVVDDGLGVPKADQHHLFTKFYRAGNAKKARPDGTGLGLFMAKKVIVAQGGAIIFRSQEGKGSTFGFSFSKSKLKVPEHLKAAPAKSRQLSEIS